MASTRILVTGGAGYVGSHACKVLASRGLRPIVFDNLSRGYRALVKWGDFVAGDVRNRAEVRAALERHRIEAVMHFAALAYVGESVASPLEYYDVNVGGTHSVLGAMREAGVETIVLSSSCATYGTPDRMPITEATAQRPINPYGRSKLMAETLLADCAAAYGFRVASLRYFNAAGADPDGELCERHDPETHLIPLAILAATGRSGPLTIFGNDYPTPDGTCVRDFVHVSDLAEGHVLALAKLDAGARSLALNLGSGHGHSVRQVVDEVARATGREVPAGIGPRREGDPPVLVADVSRAKRILGFAAPRSDLATIVADALRSHQVHLG
jgi:UDP-arabinose 4-epimerase